MDPVVSTVIISRARPVVFDYLADIANLPEFCDHFTSEWRLTREDSWGHGAGARFKMAQRFNRFPWHDVTYAEVDAPRRIVMVGRAGKFNRVRAVGIFTLEPAEGGRATRVELSYEAEGRLPSDRLLVERRGFFKRGWGRALRRLRDILEDDHGRGVRASVAGGARKPATDAPIR